MLGFLSEEDFLSEDGDNYALTMGTYNVLSGAPIYDHPIEGTRAGTIWTHGDCVRFATLEPRSITIWEAGFASKHPPTRVESLPAPNDFDPSGNIRFLPTPARLASIPIENTVLVWDAQHSKVLLNSVEVRAPWGMTFSSDGHFFVYATGGVVRLWEESLGGYVLHRTLVLSGEPLLSPNGQSIVRSDDIQLRLWRTTDSYAPPSIPAPGFRPSVLGFSPDGLLAVARSLDRSATVLDLKSGATRLIIDADMHIYGLGVAESTIVVVGDGKIVTWNLPTEGYVLNARVNIKDSVQTTMFSPSPSIRPGPIRRVPLAISSWLPNYG